MHLALVFCVTFALAAGEAPSGAAPPARCSQIGDQIAANKAEAARLRAAADQISRAGGRDPSVRIAITRDRQKADDLDKKNAALRQQLVWCLGT